MSFVVKSFLRSLVFFSLSVTAVFLGLASLATRDNLPFVVHVSNDEPAIRVTVVPGLFSETEMKDFRLWIDAEPGDVLVPDNQGMSVAYSDVRDGDGTISLSYLSNTHVEWMVSYITPDGKGDTVSESEYVMNYSGAERLERSVEALREPYVTLCMVVTILVFSLLSTYFLVKKPWLVDERVNKN